MALTTAQTITLYEILEVPYNDSVDEPVDEFRLSALTHSPTNPTQKLYTKINDRLTAIAGTDVETKLITYLTRWEDLETTVAAIDGSLGTMTGITFDPQGERGVIQSRVKVIIPVLKYIDEITFDQKPMYNSLWGMSCR